MSDISIRKLAQYTPLVGLGEFAFPKISPHYDKIIPEMTQYLSFTGTTPTLSQ